MSSRSPSPDSGTASYDPSPESSGPIISGRYKLLQKIGEGGFGVVYLAEQREPVQRTVAVKVIKPGMDSAQIIARFEQERQALALMDHPNIAKVLDGGTTNENRPFFVMELVRGIPVTKFCDDQKLPPRQRLRLFIPICQAIQHAHQKGIIHRDLKPSNVLVTLHDGNPVPKVIDFGVAKALHQRLTERTMFTEIGALIGTPEYMSPEQAGVNPLDIDTRSDVYSLGVLLYELLTGSTPLDRERLRRAAFEEMLRLIRDSEPVKPSTRISMIAELPSIAALRQVEPKKLRHLLRGDLDWVVMKAIDKDRNRRYETANGFALDIQRYLNDEPVLAGPPSTSYRVLKFLRRNRRAVLAAAAALLLLVAGIVGTSIGLVRSLAAERREALERARADENYQQARKAIDEFYTRFSGRLVDEPGAHKLRHELLDTGLRFYEGFLEAHSQDPELRAEVARTHYRIAGIRSDMGETQKARVDYGKALQIQEALVGESPDNSTYRADLAATCNAMSMLVGQDGDWPEGVRLLQQAIALRDQAVKESPDDLAALRDLASAWNNLGVSLVDSGDFNRALEAYQKAREMRAELVRREPNDLTYLGELAKSHNNLGAWYYTARDDATSLHHYEQGHTIRERLHDLAPSSLENTQELAKSHHNIALLHNRAGRSADATRHNEASRDLCEQLVRDNPAIPAYRHGLSNALRGVGISYYAQNRTAEADAALKRCYELLVTLAEQYPARTEYVRDFAQAASNWGALCQKMQRFADALTPAERAVTAYEALFKSSPNDPDLRSKLVMAYVNLGAIRSDAGQPATAIEPLDKAIAFLCELLQQQPDNPKLLDQLSAAWSNRALALRRLERWDEMLLSSYEAAKPLRRLLAQDPTSVQVRALLFQSLMDTITANQRLGHAAPAADMALECQKLLPKHPDQLYDVACALSLCVPLVGKGETSLTAEQQAERDRYADAAMDALQQAVTNGFNKAAHMESDNDLDAIRDRHDFAKLLQEMKQKEKSQSSEKPDSLTRE
jgi:serine/threonine protein kinase